MEEYDVNVRVELFDIVKAHNEDEAVKIVEEKLLKDQSLLIEHIESKFPDWIPLTEESKG